MANSNITLNDDGLTLNVQGESSEQYCTVTQHSSGDSDISVSGSHTLTAQKSITLMIQNVKLTILTDQVSVECGGSSLILSPTTTNCILGNSKLLMSEDEIELSSSRILINADNCQITGNENINISSGILGLNGDATSVTGDSNLNLSSDGTTVVNGALVSLG